MNAVPSIPTYPWKRFWNPTHEVCRLADDGYLPDPESAYGRHWNSELAPLASFTETSCLVLLGEPGAGKSTEFDAEIRRAEADSAAAMSGQRILRIDLKDYSTDGRLVDDAFRNADIQAWKQNQEILHLYFDSFDEGRLEIRNIANILVSELRRLQPYASRLRLRIVCRTAEWPQWLEKDFRAMWGDENVMTLVLAPLRRRDVAIAAATEEIDEEEFLTEMSAINAQGFATNPIGLRFLLRIYRDRGKLPSSKYELYETGCWHLCEEQSPSRHTTRQPGRLSAEQRLAVSGRIAAVTLFSGCSPICTGTGVLPREGEISVANLTGGFEPIGDDKILVSEDAIRDALSSALFSGSGSERLVFAHRTYAEFLAARYLDCRQLDEQQICSLVFHAKSETKIVPQLAETTAWIAERNRPVFERVLQGDPQILLRSDVAVFDDFAKQRLVQRLLEGFQDRELDDSDWWLRSHYGKLAHANLAEQLEPTIRDRTLWRVTRRLAIDLAEKCAELRLLDALIDVALDSTDDQHVRNQACHAVVASGDDSSIRRLCPLAFEQASGDPDDELRGNALRALWPRRVITTEQLFRCLTPPRNRSLIGSYFQFVNYDLIEYLHPEDLPRTLEWTCNRYRDVAEADFFERLEASITQRALQHIDVAEVERSFVNLLVARIQRGQDHLIGDKLFDGISENVRRTIASSLLPQFGDEDKCSWILFHGASPLIRAGDLEWTLERSADAGSPMQARAWAKLAKELFLWGRRELLDTILAHCESNTIADEVFAELFHPVEINSDAANVLRAQHLNYKTFEERRQAMFRRTLLDPPPQTRVEECLYRFEVGDLKAWWHLNQELQLEPDSKQYERDLQEDLTQFPGWLASNESTKSRILAAAKQYVSEWRSRPDEWLRLGHFHYPDAAGYRAVLLIGNFDPSFLTALGQERWANAAPAIVGFPVITGMRSEAEARQKQCVRIAYSHAPIAIIQALLALVDREDRDQGSPHFGFLACVDDCADQQLCDAMLQKCQDRSLRPATVVGLIDFVFSRDPTGAERLARSLVFDGMSHSKWSHRRPLLWKRYDLWKSRRAKPWQSSSHRCGRSISLSGTRCDRLSADSVWRGKELATKAAVVLWLNGADRWNVLWQFYRSDRAFFRDVMTAVAHQERQSRIPPASLSEEQLADLFLLLSEEFPQHEDTNPQGAHFVGPRESVQTYRNRILELLSDRGNFAAVAAIRRIYAALPNVSGLDWAVRNALRKALLATWRPLSVPDFLELTKYSGTRLVRNSRELQLAIKASLERLERRLHGETPAVRDIWDKTEKGWKPIDENEFSDYLLRHLKFDLPRAGIVPLREVEIRSSKSSKGIGERADLYVTAPIHGVPESTFDSVRVIVEVKGCWHRAVMTAMESQLKDRYLREIDCQHGIYVVGWFVCDTWTESDYRLKDVPSLKLAEARSDFESQAKLLSDGATILESVVIDASRP